MKPLFIVGMLSMVICSFIFVEKGYDKLTNYNNPNAEEEYLFEESDEEVINAYVGGDAYNYIINASQATGYFVLSGFFFVSALLLGIWMSIMTKKPVLP